LNIRNDQLTSEEKRNSILCFKSVCQGGEKKPVSLPQKIHTKSPEHQREYSTKIKEKEKKTYRSSILIKIELAIKKPPRANESKSLPKN